jgi:hypothetical protein
VHKLHSYRRLAAYGNMGHGSNQLNLPLVEPVLCSPYHHGCLSRGPSLGNVYRQPEKLKQRKGVAKVISCLENKIYPRILCKIGEYHSAGKTSSL